MNLLLRFRFVVDFQTERVHVRHFEELRFRHWISREIFPLDLDPLPEILCVWLTRLLADYMASKGCRMVVRPHHSSLLDQNQPSLPPPKRPRLLDGCEYPNTRICSGREPITVPPRQHIVVTALVSSIPENLSKINDVQRTRVELERPKWQRKVAAAATTTAATAFAATATAATAMAAGAQRRLRRTPSANDNLVLPRLALGDESSTFLGISSFDNGLEVLVHDRRTEVFDVCNRSDHTILVGLGGLREVGIPIPCVDCLFPLCEKIWDVRHVSRVQWTASWEETL